jgi:hypothetical protein
MDINMRESIFDPHQFKVGEKVLVYDDRIWQKRGYDWDNNRDCWKEAIILNIRHDVTIPHGYGSSDAFYPELIDVQFLYDNHISPSHFTSAVRKAVQ